MQSIKITLSIVMLTGLSLLFTSCHRTIPTPTTLRGKLYLSQNMWYEHPAKLYSINYQTGAIMPAGTAIHDIKLRKKAIYFKLPDSDQQYRIIYQAKYSRMPVLQFAKRLFTHKNFQELTQNLTPAEVTFIKTGVLTKGLSKAAVLIGYGYPPAHRTILSSNSWTYWKNRFITQRLIFDDQGKLESFTK